MATAPTLARAGDQAADNLYTLYAANTLKARLVSFATTGLSLISDAEEGARPVAHWLTLLASTANLMPSSAVPLATYQLATQLVFRCCHLAQYLLTKGSLRSAAAAALLAAYNAQF